MRKGVKAMIAAMAMMVPMAASATILKGTLQDPELNEGIPFASVKLYNLKDTVRPEAYFSTDIDGNFSEIFKKKGKFKVKFESIGKQTVSKEINLSGEETLDFGVIPMADDIAMMAELEVVAVRPIVKASSDKLSYSVAEDSDSKTYTLLDMLRKVPMVSVDGEDNITVNGSSSFKVYVNGKPSMMFSNDPGKIFKSMPASVVKSIDVVTNPGARYDAEGAGGILNLVMDQENKDYANEGYNATVGVRGGLKGFDGNLYFTAQTGKFSYSVNAMHGRMFPGDSKVKLSQIFPDRTVNTSTTSHPRMQFTMGSLSIGYAPDSLTTIGLTGSVNNFGMNSRTSSANGILSPSGTSMLDYTSFGRTDMNRLGANGSLTFTRDFADRYKSSLSVIYQLSYEKGKNYSSYDFDAPEESFINLSDRTMHSPENTLEHVVQADYTMHPRENQTFDAGVKLSLRRSESTSISEFGGDLPSETTTDYKTHNNIGAAYGEYSITGHGMTGKAGVRYEYTWQDVDYGTGGADDFSRHYGIFVPSASFSYSLNMASSIGATYNMRISRPGISYMNPFVDRSDPSSITYGNPHLDVEKNHNVGITYNLFTRSLMLNARLTDSYTGNGVERYSFYDDNLLNTTYGNIVKRNNVRLDLYLNWMAFPKTRLILNGSTGYSHIKSEQLGRSNSGWVWNMMAGVQQTLPFDIKASVYLMASSRNYTLEGWNSGFRMFSLNLSKSFLNDKLSVSCGFNTGLSKHGDMKMESMSHTSEFTTHNTMRIPMINVNVGISYTFGNFTPKAQRQQKNVDNDFMEEKSNMESLPGMMGN